MTTSILFNLIFQRRIFEIQKNYKNLVIKHNTSAYELNRLNNDKKFKGFIRRFIYGKRVRQ